MDSRRAAGAWQQQRARRRRGSLYGNCSEGANATSDGARALTMPVGYSDAGSYDQEACTPKDTTHPTNSSHDTPPTQTGTLAPEHNRQRDPCLNAPSYLLPNPASTTVIGALDLAFVESVFR